MITLLHHVRVLLVLVVGSVRLDDALDPIDCAWYTVSSNELCKIPVLISIAATKIKIKQSIDLLVQEVHADTKVVRHALQTDHTVGLEQLLIAAEAHLANVPTPVFEKVSVLAQEIDLDLC